MDLWRQLGERSWKRVTLSHQWSIQNHGFVRKSTRIREKMLRTIEAMVKVATKKVKGKVIVINIPMRRGKEKGLWKNAQITK